MIKFENVTKKYGDKIALDSLTLEITPGEIFGLIGHNGAGKTTTIKSLVSVIEPTYGKIFVNGLSLEDHRLEIKKNIGYVSDSPDIFLKVPVISFWELIGEIYGIDREVMAIKIEELTKIFSLEDVENSMIEELSHGMRQKVFIIGALLSEPRLWVLDEPLTGLDPQSSYNLKAMMRNHAEKGNTVLFSTHVLEVAEKLCHRIGILSRGRLIFVGTLEELKANNPEESLENIYLNMVNEDPKSEVEPNKAEEDMTGDSN